MRRHIGIEVSSDACRIVELGDSSTEDTVVRSVVRSARPDPGTLAPYQGERVAVVMWAMHADHRQAIVTAGSYRRMRREAVNATRAAGVDTREMVADIATVQTKDPQKRRPVVVALARTSDIVLARQLLTSSGVRVRSVVTPALALMSVSRLRSRLTQPGMAEAYVALEESRTALALVRDGALIAARELDWGYEDGSQSREDVAERLGAAIEEFLGDCGARPSAVAQVCVCGGMPELRGMALPLMQRLDIEVEPLDSLWGIDTDRLPEPQDEFRDRVADFRLAWAVAADWNAPINFLRERERRTAKTILTRAAVVAGIATGVALAWRIQGSDFFQPTNPAPVVKPRAVQQPAAAQATRPATPPQAVATRVSPPTPLSARPMPQRRPIQAPFSAGSELAAAGEKNEAVAAVAAPPPRIPAQPAAQPAPPPKIPEPTPKAPASTPRAPVPTPTTTAPTQTTVARQAPPAAPPLILRPVAPPPPPATVARDTSRPETPRQQQPPAGPRREPRPPREETPLPFDASLGTILYGSDRKLAIVDGRIIQVGDTVRGARVIDITPDSVLLRDAQGRLRRLASGR